jgi:hypothetical protein
MFFGEKDKEAKIKSRGAIAISFYSFLIALFTLISNNNSSSILSDTLAINDTWSYYQAKSIKQNVYELHIDPDQNIIQKYETERKVLLDSAKKLEENRTQSHSRSIWYSMAIAVVQIGIVITATAINILSIELLYASIACAITGILLFSNGFWLFL